MTSQDKPMHDKQHNITRNRIIQQTTITHNTIQDILYHTRQCKIMQAIRDNNIQYKTI